MGCLPTSPSTEMGSPADRQRIQRIMAPERRQGGSLSPQDPHTVCGNQVSPALSQVSLGAHTVERWVLSGPGGQGPGHSPHGTEAAACLSFNCIRTRRVLGTITKKGQTIASDFYICLGKLREWPHHHLLSPPPPFLLRPPLSPLSLPLGLSLSGLASLHAGCPPTHFPRGIVWG